MSVRRLRRCVLGAAKGLGGLKGLIARSDANAAGSIDVFGWVRNAFDVKFIDQLAVAPGNTGLIAGLPGDPGTWGATASLAF